MTHPTDSEIDQAIIRADLAHKAAANALAQEAAAVIELALVASRCKQGAPPPPVEDPPEEPPPPVTVGRGCPEGIALQDWPFKPVTGGGRPTGVPPWSKGARISRVHFHGAAPGYFTETGICTGQTGYSEDIEVTDSIIGPAAKWHGRVHKVRGLRVLRTTDQNGPEEHDWYIEPIGGQALTEACFLLRNGLSERSGSQRLQVAQRSEDGITDDLYVPGGMIVVKKDKCVDHARHASEGGTGTRQSQAYKIFSAQVGPNEQNRVNRMLLHRVLLSEVILDDSMQTLSHGFGLIGANLGTVIEMSDAFMGSLSHPDTSMEAIRVESFLPGTDGSQVGPLLIEWCHFESTSGPTGPGIALLDNRPVMIRNCTGNLRIQDAAGKTIGMVKDGFSRNWTPAAQAIADEIKAAGATL